MKKLETIFKRDSGELSIDKDLNLYWNGKRIITKGKVTLQWSVNVAIIFASFSTFALAILAALELFGYGAK